MILQHIADELTRLYRVEPATIAPYLLDAPAYAAYRRRHPELDTPLRETLLIEPDGDCPGIGLYVDPDIVAHLRAARPTSWLDEAHLDACSVAIEGVSHLLYVLTKWSADLPVSLLELELQAEIDKFLLLREWLPDRELPAATLLQRLFRMGELRGGMTQAEAWRYTRANRMAHAVCTRWQRTQTNGASTDALLAEVRAFYRLTHWQKLRAIPASIGR